MILHHRSSTSLNDIGALTVEQHRIQAEMTRQEGLIKSSRKEAQRLAALIAKAEKYPRYGRELVANRPWFEMLLGPEHANICLGKTYIVKRKRSENTVEMRDVEERW